MVPDYKTVLRFDDLFYKNEKVDLQKKMKYCAPLLYLRKQIVKNKFTNRGVENFIEKLLDQKRQATLGTLNEDKQNKKSENALEEHQLII